MNEYEPWRLSCDGTAVPNPGRIGLGAVLVSPDGERRELSQAGPRLGCNNEAEAHALLLALRTALDLDVRTAVITCDSNVVVQQVAGSARTAIARLAPLFEEARALMARFERVELLLVPRRKNGEADALARAAVGLAPKPPMPARGRHRRR